MTRSEAQHLLETILRELQTANPSFPTGTTRRLFEAGELRIGLEILCDNLVEAEVALNHRAKADIESVGTFLGLPPEYWRDIVSDPPPT